jgi:hypothetical protein
MNTMLKQSALIVLIISAFCSIAQAQPRAEEREKKVQAYRVAVFTEVLNLSPSEAEAFWPIFNEYLGKREELQAQIRPSKQLDGMNDGEVEEYMRKYFEVKQREIDLEKDLSQRLRKVLPLRKIAKIPVAEREFREALVKKLQDARQRRNDRMGGGRGGRRR